MACKIAVYSYLGIKCKLCEIKIAVNKTYYHCSIDNSNFHSECKPIEAITYELKKKLIFWEEKTNPRYLRAYVNNFDLFFIKYGCLTIGISMIKDKLFMWAISSDFCLYIKKTLSDIQNLIGSKSLHLG